MDADFTKKTNTSGHWIRWTVMLLSHWPYSMGFTVSSLFNPHHKYNLCLTVGLIREWLRQCKTLFSKSNPQFLFLVYVRPPDPVIQPACALGLVCHARYMSTLKNNSERTDAERKVFKRRRQGWKNGEDDRCSSWGSDDGGGGGEGHHYHNWTSMSK